MTRTGRSRLWVLSLLAIVSLILLVPQSPVWFLAPTTVAAASFTVNGTADVVDANPGDGTCATATAGQCTLRAAIQEANALPGADSITALAGTYTLSVAGADEDAAATGDLNITGD